MRITLPDHFWDGFGGTLLGAITGGVLAIVGAYLANRYLANREAKTAHDSEKHDLAAALRIVRYELVAMCASVDSLLKYNLADLPTPVTDSAFRSVQLVIARHYTPEYMTPIDRAQLVNAYALLAFVTRDVKLLQATKPWPQHVITSLTTTNTTLKAVDNRLKEILTLTLGVPEA